MRFRKPKKPTYAQGGVILPRSKESRIATHIILSEGYYLTPERARAMFGDDMLKKINEGGRPMPKTFLSRLRAAVPCLRCRGRGWIAEKGRRLTKSELTPSQYAQTLAEGAFYYEEVVKPCPKCGVACGATEWAPCEGYEAHVYGVCDLPKGHDGRFHRELRNGRLWASWSGDSGRIPVARCVHTKETK